LEKGDQGGFKSFLTGLPDYLIRFHQQAKAGAFAFHIQKRNTHGKTNSRSHRDQSQPFWYGRTIYIKHFEEPFGLPFGRQYFGPATAR
jgi:hypothetical protein